MVVESQPVGGVAFLVKRTWGIVDLKLDAVPTVGVVCSVVASVDAVKGRGKDSVVAIEVVCLVVRIWGISD